MTPLRTFSSILVPHRHPLSRSFRRFGATKTCLTHVPGAHKYLFRGSPRDLLPKKVVPVSKRGYRCRRATPPVLGTPLFAHCHPPPRREAPKTWLSNGVTRSHQILLNRVRPTLRCTGPWRVLSHVGEIIYDHPTTNNCRSGVVRSPRTAKVVQFHSPPLWPGPPRHFPTPRASPYRFPGLLLQYISSSDVGGGRPPMS